MTIKQEGKAVKFCNADTYVGAPKTDGKAWRTPTQYRTKCYTPDLSTSNGSSEGRAPKCNKQPTEA